ncbi:MAG: AAA family ATPase [Candidatus Pacearchaeota archaeon]
MIIKRIRLKDIRSFQEQEILFPKGKILLAGDIGSGKSTVLLALEFALFGLQPGFISGASLLRKGSDFGEVELEFELQGKNIIISRSLKRKKNSIGQDKGFLQLGDLREQLSPEELRARVLELMNYPSSLLKTRGNLLFRFTLYTPQEQMRQILIEGAEERIDTLRKIFGIDKYKNIEANLDIFSSKIKEQIKLLEIQAEGIENLTKDYEERKKEMDNLKKTLDNLSPLLELARSEVKEKEKMLKKIDEQVRTLHFLRTENASVKAEYTSNLRHLEDVKEQVRRIQDFGEIKFEEKNFKEQLEKLSKELEEISFKMKNLLVTKTQQESKKKEIQDMKEKIISLSVCPTCQQKVSDSYKQAFLEDAKIKLESLQKNISELEKGEQDIKKSIEKIEEEIFKIREEEKEVEILKEKFKFWEQQKKIKQKLIETLDNLAGRQQFLLEKLKQNQQDLEQLKDIEVENEKMEKELNVLKEKERNISIEKAKLEKEFESVSDIVKKLEQEIRIKKKYLEEAQEKKKLNEWISEHLIPLVLKIEKNVMLTVNLEFNKMFGSWFSMLVENLNARVNEDFTPIIEQQGYEIEYGALSGGERTAAALAYRLALNQIINSLMSNLATRGLLILDEPTDGFSSEQLDKMSKVLEEIKVDQLFLVSHEAKIENFVEHVLRFKKENNRSYVL